MTQESTQTTAPVFRVFADHQGKVYLAMGSGPIIVEVDRPVSSKNLDRARKELLLIAKKRAKANKEIEAVLEPRHRGRWLDKLESATWGFVYRCLTILISLVLIAAAYKGVEYSSEHFPEQLHIAVLCFYVVGLAFLITLIGTEENRLKYQRQILVWLGPRGMLVLPILLLGTAGSVMASITFRLHQRGSVILEMCSGRPITEAGLLDFYMWHFMNLVPLLQLNILLRWGEPYCYKQSRVGFLILAFQLFVVIPSFNTIRFYWKHRQTPPEYVYDPHWNPYLPPKPDNNVGSPV